MALRRSVGVIQVARGRQEKTKGCLLWGSVAAEGPEETNPDSGGTSIKLVVEVSPLPHLHSIPQPIGSSDAKRISSCHLHSSIAALLWCRKPESVTAADDAVVGWTWK